MAGQFVVGGAIAGYTIVELDDTRMMDRENTVIFLLKKELSREIDVAGDGAEESTTVTSSELIRYYNVFDRLLKIGAKVVCINAGDILKNNRILLYKMMAYGEYNIYCVPDESLVTKEYADKICSREPDKLEVEQYVGGDFSAYEDLEMLLFGIQNLVEAGDMEGLREFIGEHIDAISSSMDMIEYLKFIADGTSRYDLLSEVENYKKEQEGMRNKLDAEKVRADQAEEERDSSKAMLKESLEKISELSQKISDMQGEIESVTRGGVLSSYKEIKTSTIPCKTRNIIYFKEVSRTRFINSLVVNLFSNIETVFKNQDKRVKLMIYDTDVGIAGIYRGISVFDSRGYMMNRDNTMRVTQKYVISEPNPIFLEDVLKCVNPEFDVVIIYDRMRQKTDIVSGNNVTKIFVIDSFTEYENVKDELGIGAKSMVITSDTKIPNGVLIPVVDGYEELTTSAKMYAYGRTRIGDKEPVMQQILNEARINLRQ